MYCHILLAHDGSEPSLAAERECLALAKTVGAKVTVMQVVSPVRLFAFEDVTSRTLARPVEVRHENMLTAEAEAALAQVQARARARGVECERAVALGSVPCRELIAYAATQRCDLIVVGARGRTNLGALLHGSETASVIRRSPVPVLVVRGGRVRAPANNQSTRWRATCRKPTQCP